jgi:hypothetical protein
VPDGRLAGTDDVSPLTSFANPGRGEVYRMAPAAASGTAMALRLYLDAASTASKLVVGLYANSRVENDPDDEAGALLGTATLLDPRPGAWNEVRLPEPVPIVAGATYWFALLNPHDATGRLIWHDRASEPYGLERTSQSLALTALP